MSMLEHYDRQGHPITFEEYCKLIEPEYKRVASTDVGPYWVSTVWLGLNHQFGDGPPLIFETMVFAKGERDDPDHVGLREFDMRRYSTEAEALAGHEEAVLMIEATLQEADDVLPDHQTNGSDT